MSKAWQGANTRAWRKVRALVLARDGYTCQVRTQRCVGTADCVHHTAGRGVTGDDPRWLLASCTPCNLLIGDPTKSDPPGRSATRW